MPARGNQTKEPGYYLVNTNKTYRPESQDFMLANECVVAQYSAKDEIDTIVAGALEPIPEQMNA